VIMEVKHAAVAGTVSAILAVVDLPFDFAGWEKLGLATIAMGLVGYCLIKLVPGMNDRHSETLTKLNEQNCEVHKETGKLNADAVKEAARINAEVVNNAMGRVEKAIHEQSAAMNAHADRTHALLVEALHTEKKDNAREGSRVV
jgi:hypothetical protein